MAAHPTPAVKALAWHFRRNGYVRRQNPERVASKSTRPYHKGEEVRLVANSCQELRELRRLLRAAGFEPGRPFRKARQYRQPIYGRLAVAVFLALVQSVDDD
jgi:hypothetical protein